MAVSLSVQDVLANVVSGMVILISKPFVSGNYIATEKAEGEVESIGLMYTHLITPDNKAVVMPIRNFPPDRSPTIPQRAVAAWIPNCGWGLSMIRRSCWMSLMQAAKHAGEGHEVGKPPFVGINAYLDNAD